MSNRFVASYTSKSNPEFYLIELGYSVFHFLSGHDRWYCRIWHKNYPNSFRTFNESVGESFGKNKYQAYRSAVKDLRRKF